MRSRAVLRPSVLSSDRFGKNFMYVLAGANIMDFHSARIFIDLVNDPVTPGAKRQIARRIALKAFSRMGLLRQQLDGSLESPV
jgi:hypothetical protein